MYSIFGKEKCLCNATRLTKGPRATPRDGNQARHAQISDPCHPTVPASSDMGTTGKGQIVDLQVSEIRGKVVNVLFSAILLALYFSVITDSECGWKGVYGVLSVLSPSGCRAVCLHRTTQRGKAKPISNTTLVPVLLRWNNALPSGF